MTRRDQDKLGDRVDDLARAFGVEDGTERPQLTDAQRRAVLALYQYRYDEWRTWTAAVDAPPSEVGVGDPAFLALALEAIDAEHAAVLRGERSEPGPELEP